MLFCTVFWCSSLPAKQSTRVTGVYRVFYNTNSGLDIWIVDGKKVREEINPEFLYGGNNQRYPFVPKREIWIDNAITAEELNYTIAHELLERDLMAKRGLTYEAAHDSGLMLEHTMRLNDLQSATTHERSVGLVSPTDSYGERELAGLADSVPLPRCYLVFLGRRNDLDIWIVDGAAIRRDIYPDFGLSGNDLAYHFIPANEIWIDDQVSCEEMEFSILIEMRERLAMQNGVEYDIAYQKAIEATHIDRKKATKLSMSMPPVVLTGPLTREQGTGEERK